MNNRKISCPLSQANIDYSTTTKYKNPRVKMLVAVLIALVTDLLVAFLLALRIQKVEYIFFPLFLVLLDLLFLLAIRFVNFRFNYSIALWGGYCFLTALVTMASVLLPSINMGVRLISTLGIVVVGTAQLVKVVLVAVLGVFSRKESKTTRNIFGALIIVLLLITMLTYSFSNITNGFMGQGSSVLNKNCTVVYRLNEKDNTYIVSDILGDGDRLLVPDTFSNKPVSSIECSIFNKNNLKEIEILGQDKNFIGFENITSINQNIKILVSKTILNAFRSDIYQKMQSASIKIGIGSIFLDAIAPSDLLENQVCYNVSYAQTGLIKKLGLQYIPSVIKKDDQKLELGDLAIDQKYIGHNDIESADHRAWCYQNSNGFLLLPLSTPPLQENEKICKVGLEFEQIFKLKLNQGNDTVYSYPKSWQNSENFNGVYVAKSKLKNIFENLPSREGFSAEWSVSASNGGNTVLIDTKEAFESYVSSSTQTEFVARPRWSVNAPSTNVVGTKIVGTSNIEFGKPPFSYTFSYGANVEVEASYQNAGQEPFSIAKVYSLYKNQMLLESNTTGIFTLNGYRPADSSQFLMEVIAYDPTITSLRSNAVQLNFSLTFLKKELEMTWGNNVFTYDGNIHQVECTPNSASVVFGDVIEFANSQTDFTNAGNYDVTASLTGASAELYYMSEKSATAKVVVNPKPVDVVWAVQNYIYNGQPQAPTATALDIDNIIRSLEVSGSASNAQIGYIATATAISSNYKLNNPTQIFNISCKPITISSWSSTAFIYNGRAQYQVVTALQECIAGEELSTIASLEYSGYDSNIDKGDTYTVTARLPQNSNYSLASGISGAYSIQAKQVAVQWGATSLEYNGQNQHPKAEIVDVDNNTVVLNATGAQKDVGDHYTAEATFVNSNYTLTGQQQAFAIKAKAIAVTLDSKSIVYGAADVALSATVPNGALVGTDNQASLNLNIVRELGSTVKAGGYAITATYTNTNYTVTFTNGVYTITPKAIAVTLDNKSIVYGAADVALTATVPSDNLVGTDNQASLNLNIVRELGSAVKAGGYAITATYTNANYTVTFTNGVYTIAPKAIAVIWSNVNLIYNGDLQKPTATATASEVLPTDTVTIVVTGEKREVGTGYEAKASTTNNNYVITNETAVFNISAT